MVADTQAIAFSDLQGLAQLKNRAANEDPRALREAARQFEALFLQMMLESMRNAGGAFAEERDRSYEEMFDKQVAIELAGQESLGIAELLVRQIDWRQVGQQRAEQTDAAPLAGVADVTQMSTRRRADFKPQTAEHFVQEIWPLAREAGQSLGVDARVIVAQAVLETGWGNRLIRDERGISANNLFGIKAGHGWPGEGVVARTLEYEAHAFVPRQERFRAYPDLRAGFADYVEFLRSNPRYRDALAAGRDAETFASELGASGFATDPRYDEKILAILGSPRLAAYVDSSSKE